MTRHMLQGTSRSIGSLHYALCCDLLNCNNQLIVISQIAEKDFSGLNTDIDLLKELTHLSLMSFLLDKSKNYIHNAASHRRLFC